ncbi:MAG: o-succinylbenzoate synthase [Microbacteriaceae bacterium]|nr:o-succinylbenzoate synthase [Microbacteriaceae bacterium]
MLPPMTDLTETARVVALPLRQKFRGITTREALVFRGPEGWSEFSPFLEYDDCEASLWLAAAIEFAFEPTPTALRDRIPVNATLPAVSPDQVATVLDAFPGCRTVKVKVADIGQQLSDDVARVAAVRAYLGPEGRIRIDANANWNVDEAEHAIHALAGFDLEYVEQPCASIDELAEIRERVKYMLIPIAADESVRRVTDPLDVARAGAADLLVLKAQPLGGIRASLAIATAAGLPVVVSSALDTSIGLALGAHLAAALPTLEFDCGLGTAALLAADVCRSPLLPVDGYIPVWRPNVDPELLHQNAVSPERTAWWLARLERCHELLAAEHGVN